jgi:acyl dehydratase
MNAIANRPKGRYFEELAVGTTFMTAGRTVTLHDIVAFTAFSGEASAHHDDAEAAGQSHWRGRVAQGLLGPTVVGGLLARLGIWEGTAIAMLGVSWKFRAPIRPGDTVRADIVVGETKLSRDPRRGVVIFDIDVRNQREELVQEGRWTAMMMTASDPANPTE